VALQQPVLIYDRISSNKRKTFLLLVAFFVITSIAVIAVGYIMGLPLAFSPFIVLFVLSTPPSATSPPTALPSRSQALADP
jgi:hypothetical protein